MCGWLLRMCVYEMFFVVVVFGLAKCIYYIYAYKYALNCRNSGHPQSFLITMASSGYLQAAVLLLTLQILSFGAAYADQDTGTVIPAESRWIYT